MNRRTIIRLVVPLALTTLGLPTTADAGKGERPMQGTLEVRHVSVSINRTPREVYD